MKTSRLIFTLAALLSSLGCVTARHERDQVDLAKWTELKRCDEQLDQLAEICANIAQQNSPIYGRGSYGEEDPE